MALTYEKLGQAEKSTALLKEITSYSQNNLATNTLNHLYGLLAIKKLGANDELDTFILELKNTIANSNSKSELALALYQGGDNGSAKDRAELLPRDILEAASWAIKQ